MKLWQIINSETRIDKRCNNVFFLKLVSWWQSLNFHGAPFLKKTSYYVINDIL